MDCEEAWNLISANMDGEISASDRPGLDAHLAVCADCRAVAEAFKIDDSDLRRAFVPRRKAAQAVAGRAVADLRPAGGWHSARGYFLAVVAAAAGFAVAALVFRPWERPAAPVQVAAPSPVPSALQPPEVAIVKPLVSSVAQLAVASGLVEMLVGELWQPVPTGGQIEPGTRVRTGPDAFCELRTVEGSEVRLSASTDAAFETNRRIALSRGRMFSSVKEDKEPFEVKVPDANVTALGTKFDLELVPETTLLRVIEGTTKVTGKGGVDYVGPGFRAKIARDTVVVEREGEILRATSWVNKILALKGPDDPELASRLLDLLAYIGEGKMKMLVEPEILELGDSCVKPLLSYVLSQRSRLDRDRRLNAARIACKLATRPAVHELIQLLADDSREVRAFAAEALERLTGETQGRKPDEWRTESFNTTEATYKKWLAWWEAHRGEYAASGAGGALPQKTK